MNSHLCAIGSFKMPGVNLGTMAMEMILGMHWPKGLINIVVDLRVNP